MRIFKNQLKTAGEVKAEVLGMCKKRVKSFAFFAVYLWNMRNNAKSVTLLVIAT
jgi:hypothetical protein